MKYLEAIDPTEFKRPAVMISRLVPDGAVVLDIGCAGGRVAKLFKDKGCRVVGVEADPDRATVAKEVCDEVVIGDIEEPEVMTAIARGFQAIICSDVLEHMRDPGRVLRALKEKLVPGGRVYISIPNLLQWRVRWRLLRGEFRYEATGVFDETHLRFYSYESAKELCRSSGYRLVEERFAWDVPFGNRMGARYRHHPDSFPRSVVRASEWLAGRRPGLLAGHFVFVLLPES